MKNYDVIIIGGGPAGCASAIKLKKLGYHVCLVEKSVFPRFHLGESLLSMSIPFLKELDVLEDIETAGFLKKYGSLFVWGPNLRTDELLMPGEGYAWQVERSKFDHLLLEKCKKIGVEVILGKMEGWVQHGKGQLNIIQVKKSKEIISLSSKYIIDASGQSKVSKLYLQTEYEYSGKKRLAVFGQFPNVNRLEGNRRNHIITEATYDGWLWLIPLKDNGLSSIGFVTESDKWEGVLPKDILFNQIEKSQIIKSLLKNSEISFGPGRQEYYNAISKTPVVNKNIFQVGDSLMFVDPLFSTGVQLAFFGAILAAKCIDALYKGELGEDEIIQYYNDEVTRYYNRTNTLIRTIYELGNNTKGNWFTIDSTYRENIEETLKKLTPSGAKFFEGTTLPVSQEIIDYANNIKYVTKNLEKINAISKFKVDENEIQIEETFGSFDGELQRCIKILSKKALFEPIKMRNNSIEYQAYLFLQEGTSLQILQEQFGRTKKIAIFMSILKVLDVIKEVKEIEPSISAV